MHASHADRFRGSLVAAAVGDAFGAPHEGGPLERCLWGLIGRRSGKRRWTDDTQMTLDVMESLLALGSIDPDDLARRFAASYRWSRGYGPGTTRILRRIRRGVPWREAARQVFRDGSYGNGGAMRAPVVGLFFARADADGVAAAASEAAAVTHAHPLALSGAVLVALATAFSLGGLGGRELLECLAGRAEAAGHAARLDRALGWLGQARRPEAREVAEGLGNGIAAAESCVTAIYLAQVFRERPYEELLAFAVRLGGDVDTIASMASAIWGASRGLAALPESLLESLEDRERITELAGRLAGMSAAVRPAAS